ncbi:unnamed protein product [Cercospora beticola]|nr:unnamed protein product [Cercospora beticola]
MRTADNGILTEGNLRSWQAQTISYDEKSKKHLRLPSILNRRSSSKEREARKDSHDNELGNQDPSIASAAAANYSLDLTTSISDLKGQFAYPVSTHDPESQCVRAKASTLTLLKWSDHNHLALKAGVGDLRTAINDLRDYVELRRPINPGAVLALQSESTGMNYVPNLEPALVKGIHEAIKRVNASPISRAKILSLSIANSCQDNRHVLGEFPGMSNKLRRDSSVTFLQRHDADAACTFLAIESDTEPSLLAQTAAIDDLSALKPPIPVDFADQDRYIWCGSVTAQSGELFHHEIYMEVERWKHAKSFSELLDDPESAASLSPEMIPKLFRVILLAYLDFQELRSSCRYPRLEDYHTYQYPVYTNDRISTQVPSEQPWENPYWACGLGSPNLIRIPGASRPTVAADEPVVRLGLVLFQLASRSKKIMAATPTGSEKNWLRLQRDALRAIQNVQDVCGVAIGTIVEACLLSNAQTEHKTLCECLLKLNKIEAES